MQHNNDVDAATEMPNSPDKEVKRKKYQNQSIRLSTSPKQQYNADPTKHSQVNYQIQGQMINFGDTSPGKESNWYISIQKIQSKNQINKF